MDQLNFSLLYANKAFLTALDIRRIVQASVFVADQILLPSTVWEDPSLDDKEKAFVATRLRELHEIGALKFWGVEGQAPLLSQQGFSSLLQLKPDIVVPIEQYSRMYEETIELVMEQRITFLGGPEATSYDGITEIVAGKQELWRLSLCNALGANRLMLDKVHSQNIERYFADLFRYTKFEAQVIEQISEKLKLPDVSQLSISDIEKCRKYMPDFRNKLAQDTGHYNQLTGAKLVERIADAIINDYLDRIESKAFRPAHAMLDIGREVVWDLLQYIFAPIIAAKYAKLFLKLIKGKDSSEILLYELRKIAKRDKS